MPESIEKWISYPEFLARELNRIFEQHGTGGAPGWITAGTVTNALEKASRRGEGEQ